MINKQSKRKILLITFIVAVLVLPVIPVGAKKCPLPSSITVEKISSKITRFKEKIPLELPDSPLSNPPLPEDAFYTVSVYAVKVRGGIVLIDCGDEELATDLYEAVSIIFSQPITAVYVTHYHADHAGAGSYFQTLGIPVYAPEAEAGAILLGAAVQPGIPDAFTYEGYTPNGYYEAVELERGFKIVLAPGHTPGAVHVEYTKGSKSYLFTADTLLPMGSFNPFDPDFTYELSFQTAYQNYELELLGYGTAWTDQLNTLNGMLDDISSYELVLTGHTPILTAEEASNYITYTMGVFPPIPIP